VRDRDELLTLDCPFPSILKPAFREGPNRLTTAKAWRVDDRPTLLARFDEAAALVPPETILIQELIPGGPEGQFSYAALCVDAQPRASVTARRVRQFPMDLGRASTYVETVDETDVVKPSLRLLEALRFSGLVEIEYKRDPRDGRCKLLDVNPRVWGWHSVCRRAGVDFPLLVWRQALGRAVPELCGSTGVRWVRITTDLSASMREIARGRMSLRTYLASLRRPIESAIFAWDDPWPGLLEVPSMTYLFGKRLLRGEDL
jgi:predicted ATP-grasp superfamily ATP-dependent carboligase